jgi:hypothetical protein
VEIEKGLQKVTKSIQKGITCGISPCHTWLTAGHFSTYHLDIKAFVPIVFSLQKMQFFADKLNEWVQKFTDSKQKGVEKPLGSTKKAKLQEVEEKGEEKAPNFGEKNSK